MTPKVVVKIIVPSWDQIFRRRQKISSFLVYFNEVSVFNVLALGYFVYELEETLK